MVKKISKEKIRKEKVREEKFNKKIYERKKLKLRSLLEVGEEVLVLASRLKKKDSLGKFDNKLTIKWRKIFLLVEIFKIWKKKLKSRFQR